MGSRMSALRADRPQAVISVDDGPPLAVVRRVTELARSGGRRLPDIFEHDALGPEPVQRWIVSAGVRRLARAIILSASQELRISVDRAEVDRTVWWFLGEGDIDRVGSLFWCASVLGLDASCVRKEMRRRFDTEDSG